MTDSEGRPDEEVSEEHWNAFIARNRSIIVDLMYGQLKSTVRCLSCHNVSITFDPFLTLPLPIARPFKILLDYIPYDYCKEDGTKNPCLTLSIALNKDAKVKDLKQKIGQIVEKPGDGSSIMVVLNYNRNTGKVTSKYQQD